MSIDPKKPYKNLLFLLADQFRHDALGCVGNPIVKTPRLDALASEGILYRRAYTPLPVCAPARQALLCGRHPDSFGAYWNHSFFPTPPFEPETTFTQRLKDSGKAGGFIGKWDVSRDRPPSSFGFDYYAPKEEYGEYIRAKYPSMEFTGGWMGCKSPVSLEDSPTHYMARQATNYMRKFTANDSDGFFLWVDLGVPHLPCRPSEPFSHLYDNVDIPPWPGYFDTYEKKPYCHRQQSVNWRLEGMPWDTMKTQVAHYYGMVSQIDDAVGIMLDELERLGLREDTLVVFTSDHGDMCGNHRMFDKHYVLYDDTVRVPLILRGRGIRSHESDALVSNCLDLPLTICEQMGLESLSAPHGFPLPLEGGDTRSHITSSANGQQFGMFNCRMISDGQYKYVWNLTDTDEFYDTKEDPGECLNLIDSVETASEISRMRKLLYEDLRSHGDPFASDWVSAQLLEGRKI